MTYLEKYFYERSLERETSKIKIRMQLFVIRKQTRRVAQLRTRIFWNQLFESEVGSPKSENIYGSEIATLTKVKLSVYLLSTLCRFT